MPPRGVKKGTKRARQYEHIKDSLEEQGKSESVAEEIAARTVNKERARHGESQHRIADVDARHLAPGAAAGCAPAPIARRAARATSSTTRRSTWASKAARR